MFNEKPTRAINDSTPRRNGATLNKAQSDVLSKLKAKELSWSSPAPKSPLALPNLDKETDAILIKKRKNVIKYSVSTQTDASYLQTNQYR
jgi:hypothetical protein